MTYRVSIAATTIEELRAALDAYQPGGRCACGDPDARPPCGHCETGGSAEAVINKFEDLLADAGAVALEERPLLPGIFEGIAAARDEAQREAARWRSVASRGEATATAEATRLVKSARTEAETLAREVERLRSALALAHLEAQRDRAAKEEARQAVQRLQRQNDQLREQLGNQPRTPAATERPAAPMEAPDESRLLRRRWDLDTDGEAA